MDTTNGLASPVPEAGGREGSMIGRLGTLLRSRTRLRRDTEPDGSGVAGGDSRMSQEEAQQYLLRKEVAEVQTMINKLAMRCEEAQSYREKSSKLLEAALRALGRLKQHMYAKDCSGVILTASELKACIQQGLTLINVYGKQNTVTKMVTCIMRKSIYTKFDRVIEQLTALLPAPVPPSLPLAHAGTATTAQLAASDSGSALPNFARPLARSSPGLGLKPSAKDVARDISPQVEGAVIKHAKHEKVYSLAYVPSQLAGSYAQLWWSTGNMLEVWSEADGSTTAFAVNKDKHVVTCLAVDHAGNVWTGHIKGLIRTRQRGRWDFPAEDKAFSSPVRVIAFDERGLAWCGDADGKVKVMKHTPAVITIGLGPSDRSQSQLGAGIGQRGGSSGSLANAASLGPSVVVATLDSYSYSKAKVEVVATLQQSLMSKVAQSAKSMLLPSMWGVLSGKGACQAHSGRRSGSGGGSGSDSSTSGKQDLMSQGPVRCILVRDDRAWIAGGQSHCTPWLALFDAVSYTGMDVFVCKTMGSINAIRPLSWPQQVVLGAGSQGGSGVQQELAPATWRLLTAHENGQLLMWHPRSTVLAPLIRIGEPMSPIRGLHVLEEQSLVLTAHQNGEMHVFVQQRIDATVLPPGSDSTHPESLGTVRPKKLIIKAHKSTLALTCGSRHSIATASTQGTIRQWRIADIVSDAERAGLVSTDRMSNAPSHVRHSSTSVGFGLSAAPTAQEPLAQAGSTSSGGVPRSRSDATEMELAPGQAAATRVPTSAGSASTAAASMGLMNASSAGADAHGGQRHSSAHDSGALGGVPATVNSQGTGSDAAQLGQQLAFTSACQTIDSSELALRKMIGQGAYGKVWLAEWTGCAVAVKELLGFGADDDGKLWAEMQNEVHMLGTYNHPNVVRFVGVCCNPPSIIMQYYSHGSLFDLLTRARNGNPRAVKELTWNKRLDMLRDVAAGMHYLHTRKPPVIHGDLRSPNLLLDLTIDRERPRFHVKIADFGLARMLQQNSLVVNVSKTTNPRWTAPEVIKNSQIGPAGDVYSFGVIMYEVLTWQQPYAEMMTVQVILRTVTDHDRPIIPPDDLLPGNPGHTLQQYKELMERCWSPDVQLRPTFKQIIDAFQAMREFEAKVGRSPSVPNTQAAGGSGPATPAPAPGGMHGTVSTPVLSTMGTPNASLPASPFANSTGEPPLVAPSSAPSAPVGTPVVLLPNGASAATSGSSIKSEAAAALLAGAAVPAKDSASSIAGAEASQLLSSWAAKAAAGGAAVGLPVPQGPPAAPGQGAAAGTPPRAGGASWAAGSTMSPIVEERSTSLEAHALMAAQPPHPTPALSLGNGLSIQVPGAGALIDALNAQGTGTPGRVGVAPSGPSVGPDSLSRGFGPVNLLDGDPEVDPLEAYRSGVLDDLGYSFLQTPVALAAVTPTLSKVAEEADADLHSDVDSVRPSPQQAQAPSQGATQVQPAAPARGPVVHPFAQMAAAGLPPGVPAGVQQQLQPPAPAPRASLEGKPYAPLSAFSPFSGAAAVATISPPEPAHSSIQLSAVQQAAQQPTLAAPASPTAQVKAMHRPSRSHEALPHVLGAATPSRIPSFTGGQAPGEALLRSQPSGGASATPTTPRAVGRSSSSNSRSASPAVHRGPGAPAAAGGSAMSHPSRLAHQTSSTAPVPHHTHSSSVGAVRWADPASAKQAGPGVQRTSHLRSSKPLSSAGSGGGSRNGSPQRTGSASLGSEVAAGLSRSRPTPTGASAAASSGRGSGTVTPRRDAGGTIARVSGSGLAAAHAPARPAFGSAAPSRMPPRQPSVTPAHLARSHTGGNTSRTASQQLSAPASPGASSTTSAGLRNTSYPSSPSASSGRMYSTELGPNGSQGLVDGMGTPRSSAQRTSPAIPLAQEPLFARLDSLPQAAAGPAVPQVAPPAPAPVVGASADKVYAPMTAFSPFAGNMEPWPSDDGPAAAAPTGSSASTATTAPAARPPQPAPPGNASPRAIPARRSPQAAATEPSPLQSPPGGTCGGACESSAISMPDVTAPHPASAYLNGGGGFPVQSDEGRPFATLTPFSPFSAAALQGEPVRAPAPTVRPGTGLSAYSPFAAAQGDGNGAVGNGAVHDAAQEQPGRAGEGKPYAPLSAHSPFSAAVVQGDAPVSTSDKTATPPKEAEGKPYAPLSAYSPFSAAAGPAWD